MSATPLMFLIAFFMGCASAYLARRMERNPYLWFGIGFLFGICGIFAIFFVQPKKKPSQPVFTLHGPTDKLWYYLEGNAQKGPMSRDAVFQAWKAGTITPQTYVWHEELTDWKLLKETIRQEG